jgi:hypothetical protein
VEASLQVNVPLVAADQEPAVQVLEDTVGGLGAVVSTTQSMKPDDQGP